MIVFRYCSREHSIKTLATMTTRRLNHIFLASVLAFTMLVGDMQNSRAEEKSKLIEQAEDLAAGGPSKADEIMKLLEEEIKLRPMNSWAHFLRGKVYFFTERADKALQDFDSAIRLLKDKDGSINPHFEMYRARTLFDLGYCEDAKRVLEGRWAFWQRSNLLREEYEAIYPQVLSKCREKGAANN